MKSFLSSFKTEVLHTNFHFTAKALISQYLVTQQ